MDPEICTGCDYHNPKFFTVAGRACAPFKTCVTVNRCGMRSPALTAEERKRFYGEENEERKASHEQND